MNSLAQFSQQNPTWTLEEFVDTANQLLPEYLPEVRENQRVGDEINPRLVRHYTSQGLLAEPQRQGRYAVYHYPHLLQILLVRRLMSKGIGLSAIADLIRNKGNTELENLLTGGGIQIEVSPPNPHLARNSAENYLQSLKTPNRTKDTKQPHIQTSTWYHLEVIPGLEIHIHSDFHHPETPSEQKFLKQQIVQTLENFQKETMTTTTNSTTQQKNQLDLTGLKWIKNVKHQDSDRKWAYQNPPEVAPGRLVFGLNWRTGYEENASKPQPGEMILLKQEGKITHLVRVLDNGVEKDPNPHNTDFKPYRLVEVVWITPDWENPPSVEQVCQCKLNLQNGKVSEIKNFNAFQEYWNENRGGLTGFQEHIRQVLDLG
ncbi:MAG: MerR family transcriptional regulator [Chroococcales cyanobacterium]